MRPTSEEPSSTGEVPAGQGPPAPAEGPTGAPKSTGDDPVRLLTEYLTEPVKTVSTVLTLPQAILKCTSLGYNALLTRAAWNACLGKFTAATPD